MLSLTTENSHDIKLQTAFLGQELLNLAKKKKKAEPKAYIKLTQSLS